MLSLVTNLLSASHKGRTSGSGSSSHIRPLHRLRSSRTFWNDQQPLGPYPRNWEEGKWLKEALRNVSCGTVSWFNNGKDTESAEIPAVCGY